MNKTVKVVSAWIDYESQNPGATLEKFYKYMASERDLDLVKSEHKPAVGINYPSIYLLTRTINRLSRLWMYFTLQSVKPLGLTSFDEFAFLYTINKSRTIRKKDVIYGNLIEISSGLLVIDRLLKKGLLMEVTDEGDKRAKLVSLTQLGTETLESSHKAVRLVAEELYGKMSAEEMGLCIDHLTVLEKSIAQRWHHIKRFEPVAT